jgi:glycosyltransferase involved in cell wall biosynthesis
MESNTRKILLFQKVVPSYRVPVFRKLYQNYGVITCHSREKKGNIKKSFVHQMDFPNELIPLAYLGLTETTVIQNIMPVLCRYKPEIVISQFSLGYITCWLLYLLKPFFRYRLILWTHGVRNNEIHDPFRTRSRKLFLWFLKNADAVIFYSEGRKNIVAARLKRKDHLFVAPNTLDLTLYRNIYDELVRSGKEAVKKELGFPPGFNLIFLGRLLPEKRIGLLLEAFGLIQEKFEVTMHFIGDGPEEGTIRHYGKISGRVRQYGGIFDPVLTGKFLFASDLFIMPGYLGLGLVHAFAFGLPVVSARSTTAGPFHSPEAEYITEGENGLLCESSAKSLSDAIDRILSDPALLAKMSEAALSTAYEKCSIDNMISGFGSAVKYLSHS